MQAGRDGPKNCAQLNNARSDQRRKFETGGDPEEASTPAGNSWMAKVGESTLGVSRRVRVSALADGAGWMSARAEGDLVVSIVRGRRLEMSKRRREMLTRRRSGK